MAVLTGIDALNTALSPVLGADKALDKERGFYMGLSLGGITGSLTFASAPELQGAALFVAGSSYAEIVTYGLFGVLFNDVMQREPVEAAVVLAMLQTLLGGADPASYARHVEQNDKPPRPVLFMQAVDDPIIIMSANDRLARAFGADLIEPSDHAVAGMAAVNLPGADNFAWQSGGDKATRVLIHHPMAEVPKSDRHGALIVQNYSQETVAHCFAKILETGSCEVIDSGFVSH